MIAVPLGCGLMSGETDLSLYCGKNRGGGLGVRGPLSSLDGDMGEKLSLGVGDIVLPPKVNEELTDDSSFHAKDKLLGSAGDWFSMVLMCGIDAKLYTLGLWGTVFLTSQILIVFVEAAALLILLSGAALG